MADEERSPLLNDFQPNAIEIRHRNVERPRSLFSGEQSAKSNGLFSSNRLDAGSPAASTPGSTFVEVDNIIAIFVVAFDTRSGNLVEWCMPDDADLEGIEFKAMASGSHTLDKDFVYFKKDHHYGLACFENMRVESEIERGARMKSVGILSTSYTTLYRHMQFLETQVRHQLETPGRYTQLKAFFEDKKGLLPTSASLSSITARTPLSTPSSEILPELKITHPAGCFSQFMKFFGENIFVLWKYCLLQKRLLFFSPPPIGVVCYRVYCCCCLGNHSIPELSGKESSPFFYVNVADIETLESEQSYIACTTEKIFETKKHLYDIYIDNQNVSAGNASLSDLLKISSADKEKFQKLNNLRSAHLFSKEELGIEEEELDEEELFTSFFIDQNNRVFTTLLECSASADRQLTSDHMKNMGLDPVGDRPFLMELVETYGIDVMLMVDNPCCPR